MIKDHNYSKNKKERPLLKAVGSVLFAIVASSHHWLHTLLIALGLTTLGTGLLSLPPNIRLIFLMISLILSVWFLRVAKLKWSRNRPAAWVYLISSPISIILVITAIPDTITSVYPQDPVQQQQEKQQNTEQQHNHDEHI